MEAYAVKRGHWTGGIPLLGTPDRVEVVQAEIPDVLLAARYADAMNEHETTPGVVYFVDVDTPVN